MVNPSFLHILQKGGYFNPSFCNVGVNFAQIKQSRPANVPRRLFVSIIDLGQPDHHQEDIHELFNFKIKA